MEDREELENFLTSYLDKNEEVDKNVSLESEEFVENIVDNPRGWFPIQIRGLMEEDFNRMAIIAANVYAESVGNFWFGQFNNIRVKESFLSEKEEKQDRTYAYKLDVLRDVGILEEDVYGTLKRLNKARNKFAHEIDSYHPDNETEIEKEMTEQELVEFIASLFETYQKGFVDWLRRASS